MQLITIFFFLTGMLSFLIYRFGLTDGIRLSRNEALSPIIKKGSEHMPKEGEKEFMSQYSELMNYDFDKAGGMDE